jgi:N-hydroxyarylamine O-acetyltransferase
MTHGFDLDAYLERIGHSGSRRATLETLAAIHLGHAHAIPFENLNPLLRLPVRLDVSSLQQKLVAERRGGYCFEQNLLLSHALKTLGFTVTGLAARVLWNNPEGLVTPRSHMLLRIDLGEGSYVVDAGFGGLTLTGPLRLEPEIEQTTPHEPFRLKSAGDGFVMEAQIGEEWKALYRFDLVEQFQADYEVTNWYLSNNPTSHFVTGLIAARPDPDRRYALRNSDFAIHHLNGHTDRRLLTSAVEIRETLESVFRVALPDVPELEKALERLVERAA